MAELRYVSCSACDSSERLVIGKPCNILPKIKHIISSWQDVYIVQCKQCGFYYTNPMLIWTDYDLNNLYDSEYFPEPNDWWLAKRGHDACSRLSLLAKYMNCSKPIFLDIGCGEGHVMERAIERGWHTFGLDPSMVLVSRAREHLGKLATIHIEALEENTLPPNSFNAIYMDSVLEHLTDLQAAVQALHLLLKKGGVAYVLVPNEDRLAYVSIKILLWLKHRQRETPKMSPLSSPYHLVGFNKRSFRYLFTKNGFVIRYFRILRGIEPWRKTKDTDDINLKGKIYRNFESICWSLGGLVGRGAMIEAVLEKK